MTEASLLLLTKQWVPVGYRESQSSHAARRFATAASVASPERAPSRRSGWSSHRATSPGPPSISQHPCGSMFRVIATALAVASITPDRYRSATRKQLEGGRPNRDPARRPGLAGLGDRDPTELAMHIHTHASHQRSPFVDVDFGELAGERDNCGSVLSAHPDTRGGGHLQTAGAQPVEPPACPRLRSPQLPIPGHQPSLRPGPRSASCARIFIPHTTGNDGSGRGERKSAPACRRRLKTDPPPPVEC
jgi:hypothetical protein